MKQIMLYHSDCLKTMREFSDCSIDMIYLDPPFYTQRTQSLIDASGKEFGFSDTWTSIDEYLEFMRLRIIEMRRILKPSGGVFLHCNTSASHHLRVILDNIFGADNFNSEIIWSYKRWSNARRGLLPSHQTILYYTKGKNFKFNTIYRDYSPTTNVDQNMQTRQKGKNGKVIYKRDNNGQVVAADEKKGVPISDVWEIPLLNPKAKERTGYPTQKPIELLERIIRISTDEGDCVLDPFCGSGTTLVSAKLLGRRFIGIDTNLEAIELARKRLEQPFKTTSVLLKVGESAYQTKNEDELSILQQFDCDIVQRNKGIDAFLKKHYFGRPVALRIQRENEPFSVALSLLKTASEKKGCSYGVLIVNKPKQVGTDKIPSNIIVINRYSTQFELAIEERASKLSQSKAVGV